MQSVPENEAMKGFEAILKKRFEGDEVFQRDEKAGLNEPQASPRDRKDSVKSEVQETSILVRSESLPTTADSSSRIERALIGSTPRSHLPRSDNTAKPSSPSKSVVEPRDQQEKSEDAFAVLLRRRKIIESSDSEFERTGSSASELSVFSTLPRTKPKLPASVHSVKEKKAPPPPLKPKPKHVGADLKSVTLPRSLSKGSERKNSDSTKAFTALKPISSVPIESRELEQGLKQAPQPSEDLGNAPIKANFGRIQSIFDQKSRSSSDDSGNMKTGDSTGNMKSLPMKDKLVKEDSNYAETIGEKQTPQEVSTDLQKSNEIRVNVGMRLPSYQVEVHFTERGKSQNDTTRQGRLRSASIESPKKPSRLKGEKIMIKPYKPETTHDHNDTDYDNLPDNDYDNLPSVLLTEDNNTGAATHQSTSSAAGVVKKSYDHDDDDYDNLPSDKSTPKDVVKEELIMKAVYDEPDYAVPDFAIDHRVDTDPGTNGKDLDKGTIGTHEYQDLVQEPVGTNFEKSSTTLDVKTSSTTSKPPRKLARSLSLSSSQSSDSESPKSYRKFKQNRLASSKTRSSPFQKIKGVIDGMRSRSSSDASTTSYEPRSFDFANLSPRPILKSKEQNGFLSGSDSPRTVTFKALTVNDFIEPDIVKLSSDSDDFVEDTVKLPAKASNPLTLPLEPVAPPTLPLNRFEEPIEDEKKSPPKIPLAYHKKKKLSLTLSGDSNTSAQTYLASDTLRSKIPPPPSFKPPAPPSKPPSSSPPRVPVHQQTPPPPPSSFPPPPVSDDGEKQPQLPMPFSMKKKLSIKSKSSSNSLPPFGNESPPTDPPPPPPSFPPTPPSSHSPSLNLLKSNPSGSSIDSSSLELSPPETNVKEDPLSPSIPNFKPPPPPVAFEEKSDRSHNTKSNVPLPPPIPSTKTTLPPPPPPKRQDMAGVADKKFPPPPPPKRVESIHSSASHVKNALRNISGKAEKSVATKSSNVIQLDAEFDGSNKPNPDHITNGHQSPVIEKSRKPSVSGKPKVAEPMSMYMVKVLPTSPPLTSRDDDLNGDITENANYSTTRKIDDKLALDSVASSELENRSIRTDSMSSVSSVSFPPLPPESLLSRVEEDADNVENDDSQVIFLF